MSKDGDLQAQAQAQARARARARLQALRPGLARQRDAAAGVLAALFTPWAGFLAITFGVIGVIGMTAVFGAQIPFERALAREAALTEASADATAPDAQARLAALRPALDDSAPHILAADNTPLPDFPARIAAERARMLQAFGADARDTGLRLRIVLAAFTVLGALFGILTLRFAERSRAP